MAGSRKAAMEGSSTDALEGIRRAAGAYYDHLPDGKKKKVTEAFNDMDKNKDGKISLLEYVNYLKKKKAKDLVHPSIFTALDKDDNGSLDFDEAIVLFYLMKSGRALICKGCEKFLAGAYFSCSQCFFNVSVSTYEICCACYRGNKFTHHGDAIFCDNYTLLRQSRSAIQAAPRPIKKRDMPLKFAKKGLRAAGISTSFLECIFNGGDDDDDDDDSPKVSCSIM